MDELTQEQNIPLQSFTNFTWNAQMLVNLRIKQTTLKILYQHKTPIFVIEIIMILLKIVRCSLIMVILMVMCQDRINHISVTTKTL